MSRPEFIVYSRPGCHLCEQLVEELLPLLRNRADLKVRNIDENPELVRAYGVRIPVLVLDGDEVCEYRLDRDAVLKRLDP